MEAMALTQSDKTHLKSLYYDISKPGSFRGVTALYNQVKSEGKRSISRAKIKEWLKGESVYSRWKPARINYPRNSINAQFVRQNFQFDLASFENDKEMVKGVAYKQLFVGIDSFSRFGFAVPLSDRKSTDIIGALKQIFETGYKPQSAMADPAGEHVSLVTKKFLKSQGVHFYTTNSKAKTPQAERLIKTIRTALTRYRAANNTRKWVLAVKSIVHSYNLTKNRAHGEAPMDVIQSKTSAWNAQGNLMGKSRRKEKKLKHPQKLPSVGEYVRLSRLKGPFEKESTEHGSFTRKLYRITGVVKKSGEKPRFKLQDLEGQDLKGKAYLEEIQTVNYDPTQYHEVEKVLRTKTSNGVLYALVKWRGYNNRFNSWVEKNSVVDVETDAAVAFS